MYFITCFSIANIDDGFEVNDKCTWGYYSNLDKARKIVEENVLDICDGCYRYAVIEHTEEGICKENCGSEYYKYNSELDKYEIMDELPEFMKNQEPYWMY